MTMLRYWVTYSWRGRTLLALQGSITAIALLSALYQSCCNKNSQIFLANSIVPDLFRWTLFSFKCLSVSMSILEWLVWHGRACGLGIHIWEIGSCEILFGPFGAVGGWDGLWAVSRCAGLAFRGLSCWGASLWAWSMIAVCGRFGGLRGWVVSGSCGGYGFVLAWS